MPRIEFAPAGGAIPSRFIETGENLIIEGVENRTDKTRVDKRADKAPRHKIESRTSKQASRPRRGLVRKPFCEEPLDGEHLWFHADNDDQHPEIKAPTIPEELDPGVTAFFPVHFAKRWAPKGAQFVVAVASSNMVIECRTGYFIAPSSFSIWKWVLWYLDWDEPSELWVWHTGASTDRSFRSPTQAAAYLLFQLWKHDKTKWDVGMFQEIEGCGRLLSEDEIIRIAEKAFEVKKLPNLSKRA